MWVNLPKITGHHTWLYCNVCGSSKSTNSEDTNYITKHQSTIRTSHSIVLQEQTNPGLRENEVCSGFINIDWMCLLGFGEMWNFWPLLGLVQCVYIYIYQIIYIYIIKYIYIYIYNYVCIYIYIYHRWRDLPNPYESISNRQKGPKNSRPGWPGRPREETTTTS